ncbi:MAG: hypothetical protein J2P35_01875 [Actinobacteria bacterium]|nr:hypothetical protein [Actinomycetota bacterium]MBO0785644.1 hypothetical protein [Actinomycetota bacterium]
MTPHRWIIIGWVCIAATAVLAAVAAFLALDAFSPPIMRPLTAPQVIVPGPGAAPAELMGGFITAVLAGVSFFTGLACFFWAALLDSRQQLASILELLRRSAD